MKIIPLNTAIQRVDSIKKSIEELIRKKEIEVKEVKEEFSELMQRINNKSNELMSDLQLANDFASKSNELREMVEPKMDVWDLNKNVKTIISTFITINQSLSNNFLFACKKSLEMHTEYIAKGALERVDMKRANLELLEQNLRILELQYKVLNFLLEKYEKEYDRRNKELIHENISDLCDSIENDDFFNYLLLNLVK